MPKFRTERYAIWRSCERFGLKPIGVCGEWENCDPYTQASLIAYEQIREIEEAELFGSMSYAKNIHDI